MGHYKGRDNRKRRMKRRRREEQRSLRMTVDAKDALELAYWPSGIKFKNEGTITLGGVEIPVTDLKISTKPGTWAESNFATLPKEAWLDMDIDIPVTDFQAKFIEDLLADMVGPYILPMSTETDYVPDLFFTSLFKHDYGPVLPPTGILIKPDFDYIRWYDPAIGYCGLLSVGSHTIVVVDPLKQLVERAHAIS